MCLLIAKFHDEPGLALVVAANRDERYDRAAQPIALRSTTPRVLAGRDEFGGGTWLAVNEHGVVAGLTNQPVPEGQDPAKRSRGELPQLCTEYSSADEAIAAFIKRVDPGDYNPCWLLVGDRSHFFAIEVHPDRTLVTQELPPGCHVLENGPIGVPTAKTEFTKDRVGEIETGLSVDSLSQALVKVLSSHVVPSPIPSHDDKRFERRPEAMSACVHSDVGGTLSTTIVCIADEPSDLPVVRFSDGPPCVSECRDVTGLWGS